MDILLQYAGAMSNILRKERAWNASSLSLAALVGQMTYIPLGSLLTIHEQYTRYRSQVESPEWQI